FSMFTLSLLTGALCWCIGNFEWVGGAGIFRVVFWWLAFVVLTIGSERLELNRVLRPSPRVRAAFGAAAAMTVAGAAAIAFDPHPGRGVMGAGLFAFAAWLMTYDIARRTVRQSGLTRYIAVCLLAGYVWLGVAGVLLFATEAVTPGVWYDAVLHAIFVGF